MSWAPKRIFNSLRKNTLKSSHVVEIPHFPITPDSFLDVHYHYDKNDFILWWKNFLDSNQALWKSALEQRSNGKKILMATIGGGFSHRHIMNMDNLLSIALTLRGAQVDSFFCDHALPVCLKAEYPYIKPEIITGSQISQTLCKGCYRDNFALSLQLGLPVHNMSHFVTLEERQQAHKIAAEIPIAEMKYYTLNGIAVGRYAHSGVLRYFAHSDPAQLPMGVETMRRYLEAGIISYYSFIKILQQNKYETVYLTHGTYMPHGVIKEICEFLGIPVISWVITCLKQRFIFTPGETLYAMLHEPNSLWEDFKYEEKQEKEIMDYLHSRWSNKKDWLPIPKENQNIPFSEFITDKKIDVNKPMIGLLTNIVWEAYAEYQSRIFPDMLSWLGKTIRYFEKRPDLQLIIRIHPAEQMWNISRQLASEEIKKLFPILPANIFVIESNQNINTYEAMNYCDSVIIYQTQTGIELSAMEGIPIIAAGDAWIRNKKIAYEPTNEEEYFNILNQLPFKQRLSPEKIHRARKYAYHAFFRKMVPLEFMEESKDWMLFNNTLQKLDDILPNVHKGLDIICDGIINGTPIIYPAEDE